MARLSPLLLCGRQVGCGSSPRERGNRDVHADPVGQGLGPPLITVQSDGQGPLLPGGVSGGWVGSRGSLRTRVFLLPAHPVGTRDGPEEEGADRL